jgi:hypothetical protein
MLRAIEDGHRERVDAAFGHQRLGAGRAEIGDDRGAQGFEAESATATSTNCRRPRA